LPSSSARHRFVPIEQETADYAQKVCRFPSVENAGTLDGERFDNPNQCDPAAA
jgi:hypothetical protein